MDESTERRISITFPPRVYAEVQRLAEEQERSFQRQVLWLIRQGIAMKSFAESLPGASDALKAQYRAGLTRIFQETEEESGDA